MKIQEKIMNTEYGSRLKENPFFRHCRRTGALNGDWNRIRFRVFRRRAYAGKRWILL